MFVGITNTPRDYAWGSHTAIAELLGIPETGEPQAELWLGAHPGSPAVISDPSQTGGAADLAAWIAADPAAALGTGDRLTFLLKVLAAASALSLQAHPTLAQAKEGFDRENAAGIPLSASFRNYKDAFHKPELIFALSESFDALCGFRPAADVVASLAQLTENSADVAVSALADRLTGDDAIAGTFEWLISGGDDVDALVAAVCELAAGSSALEFITVTSLAAQFPGDPGIVISLLLNHVVLKRGEVLYLPAGNIHAYLNGLGIELMASSDNVLRGGLTPKHVDVAELIGVLDFSASPIPYLLPTFPVPGVARYQPDVSDFELIHVQGDDVDAIVPTNGAAIALCIAGSLAITGANGVVVLGRGESVYITPDEGALQITGGGELFVAMPGQ